MDPYYELFSIDTNEHGDVNLTLSQIISLERFNRNYFFKEGGLTLNYKSQKKQACLRMLWEYLDGVSYYKALKQCYYT